MKLKYLASIALFLIVTIATACPIDIEGHYVHFKVMGQQEFDHGRFYFQYPISNATATFIPTTDGVQPSGVESIFGIKQTQNKIMRHREPITAVTDENGEFVVALRSSSEYQINVASHNKTSTALVYPYENDYVIFL